MARTRLVDAPPRNDVYVGMLAAAALATSVGIVLLALELSADYGFEAEPKAGPTINTPKDFSRPAPRSDGTPPAPMTRAEQPPPALAAVPPEPTAPATLPPTPGTPPVATLPVSPPPDEPTAPAPAVPTAADAPPAPVPTVPPAPAPAPLRPGFVPRFPRQ